MTPEEFATLSKAVRMAVAQQPLPRTVSREDVRSEAWVGALKALDRHDPAKASLLTYASLRVRGHILDYLRSLDSVGRLARQRLKAADQAGPSTFSLDSMAQRDKRSWEISYTPDYVTPFTFEQLRSRTNLSTKEQEFLSLYCTGLSQSEIARRMHVGESRASQLQAGVVQKMRAAA